MVLEREWLAAQAEMFLATDEEKEESDYQLKAAYCGLFINL